MLLSVCSACFVHQSTGHFMTYDLTGASSEAVTAFQVHVTFPAAAGNHCFKCFVQQRIICQGCSTRCFCHMDKPLVKLSREMSPPASVNILHKHLSVPLQPVGRLNVCCSSCSRYVGFSMICFSPPLQQFNGRPPFVVLVKC